MMRLAASASLALLSVVFVACAGETVPLGELTQGASSVRGTTFPACSEPTGPIDRYTSIEHTAERITGTWYLCSGSISSPTDTAGIELTPSEATFLVASNGALVPGGATHHRTVEVVDVTAMNGPGVYQIDLSSGVGTNMYHSRTSTDGRYLELSEATSGKQSRYVRAKPKAPACGVDGTPHVYTSIDDVSSRIAGRWRNCAGGITSPLETQGIELANGRAYFLFDDGAGGLSRRVGWDYERDVEIFAGAGPGPGSYQINLVGSGTNMYFSRVSENGEALELDEATSGKHVTLSRLP